jgi:hypothetical protein
MIIGKDRILIYDFGFTNYDLLEKSGSPEDGKSGRRISREVRKTESREVRKIKYRPKRRLQKMLLFDQHDKRAKGRLFPVFCSIGVIIQIQGIGWF